MVSSVLTYRRTEERRIVPRSGPLDGHVAVVTGGSHGIGHAIANLLAEHGSAVALCSHTDPDAGEALVEENVCLSSAIMPFSLDIRAKDAARRLVAEVIEEFGHIDILVNNTAMNRDVPFHRMTTDHWEEVLTVTLTGTFNLTRSIINPMRQRHYGRIINIVSVIGQTGSAGQANFAAAESALLGFTKSLARENARHNITVNAIAPGIIQPPDEDLLLDDASAAMVERIPMQRMGQPEDVAAVVGFLAGSGAQYITGQVIGVNGGLYM